MAEIRYYVSSGLRPHLYLRVADPRNQYCVRSAHDERLIAGGSAPAPWVTFLCTDKEKSPKEIRPGAADLSRCASGSAGKSRAHFPVRPFALPPAALTLRFSPKSALAPTRRALNNAPRAQTRGSLFPILAAMLGGGYGDLSNPPQTGTRRCFQHPVWCTRAPQGFGRAPRRGSAQGCARQVHETGSLVGPAPGSKAAERRTVRHPGACFFGYFLCTSKESNPGCGAGASRIHTTPPQAARHTRG